MRVRRGGGNDEGNEAKHEGLHEMRGQRQKEATDGIVENGGKMLMMPLIE